MRRIHLIDAGARQYVDGAAERTVGIERIDDVAGSYVDLNGGDRLGETAARQNENAAAALHNVSSAHPPHGIIPWSF
jgi:hypothetical protein